MSDYNEAKAAAEALFEQRPPNAEAYKDQSEVTLTLRKGQVYALRGAIRSGLSGTLHSLGMAELFGGLSEEDQAEAASIFTDAVELDELFAQHASVADYPQAEAVEEADPFGIDLAV